MQIADILQVQGLFPIYTILMYNWVKEKLFRNCCEQWPNQIQNVSKLCTYIKFKSCYGKDPYVCT